jgi:hypothetical protein
MNLAKMQLKAREFGKEITNGNVTGVSSSSVSNTGLFSATSSVHPLTVKNSDHSHNHPHASNIIAVSVNSNGLQTKKTIGVDQARAGSTGIPEHLLLSNHTATGQTIGKMAMMMVIKI